MAGAIKEVQQFISTELDTFQKKFRASMSSHVPLLDKITFYIVKSKGKQMRPMFVLLSAKLFDEIDEPSYRAASLIELLHTATLVHDDVVDDANQRRGFFSINALWKNKIAVLVGDYLLSKGLLLALDNEDHRLLKIVSQAVKAMSEGELLQMEKTRKLDITEEVYFDIIRQKTASLIASACAAGAASVSSDETVIEKMRDFGENVGMAFQIKDDLFDYGDQKIGKPVGIDIKEKKMTLPLIYALSKASKGEKGKIIKLIRKSSNKKSTVQTVVDFVKKNNGLEYARKIMNEYKTKAEDILYTLPDNSSRQHLWSLVEYVVEREK